MEFKTTRLISLAALIALGTTFAFAESTEKPAPAAQQNKTIWDYKKELGLSEEQIQSMQDILNKFQKSLSSTQQKLIAAETQLKTMIDEEAPLDQVRTKLQRISVMTAELRYEDIQTSRRVNAVMKPEQLEQWHTIQRKARGEKSPDASTGE